VVPLPAVLLDLCLALSIALSLVVLLVALGTRDPLEFSSFPALLLVMTVFRLALNVSSTRLILTKGQAGKVIEAFGHFLIGGNYAVGVVIFLISSASTSSSSPRAPGAWPRWRRASRSTRCPASRWPSTPTSAPGSSTSARPSGGARRSRAWPTSTAPWTAPASS
jgi:hypothetical protein